MGSDLSQAIQVQQAIWLAELERRNQANARAEQLRNSMRAAKGAELIRQYLGVFFDEVQPTLENEYNQVFMFVFEGVEYRVKVGGQSADLWANDGFIVAFWDESSFVVALAEVHREAREAIDIKARHVAERAAALEMHARCVSKVEAVKAGAPAWVWPAGRELTIYSWRWCIAPGTAEGNAEYDEGFSWQRSLSGSQPLHLEQSAGVSRRTLILPPSAIPIAYEIKIASLKDVPTSLRVPYTINVPGMRHEYGQSDDDGDPQLVEDPKACLIIQIGVQPIEWLREALLH